LLPLIAYQSHIVTGATPLDSGISARKLAEAIEGALWRSILVWLGQPLNPKSDKCPPTDVW